MFLYWARNSVAVSLKIPAERTDCVCQNISEYDLWHSMIPPKQNASNGNAFDMISSCQYRLLASAKPFITSATI